MSSENLPSGASIECADVIFLVFGSLIAATDGSDFIYLFIFTWERNWRGWGGDKNREMITLPISLSGWSFAGLEVAPGPLQGCGSGMVRGGKAVI